MYINNRINLSIIIPEYDVLIDEDSIMFLSNKINPLIECSCNLWDTGMIINDKVTVSEIKNNGVLLVDKAIMNNSYGE